MRFIDEFRQPALARALASKIQKWPGPPVQIMEVCGTHTVAIFRHGLRGLLPPQVNLLSGPGCPVCVTPNAEIDKAIALATNPKVILATFGDMMRVPGSYSSLAEAKAQGAQVRVVYSATEALEMALDNPEKAVVFFGVGFETTAPTTAACILEAERLGLKNFYFLSVHKVVPPAMKALLQSGEVRIDGFLCPGHVSAIIGSRPYEFIPRDYGIPCVIAGFEPVDILQAIAMILEMRAEGRAEVAIQYRRVVRPEGNPSALWAIARVFQVSDSEWRGLGLIPSSGLRLGLGMDRFAVEERFEIKVRPAKQVADCRCGDILRGLCPPPECRLFGTACTPEHAVGPCMVSSEGTCAAWFLYSAGGRIGGASAVEAGA
ncbi:MAG: hydrogenase formation protein HypD [Chloroflexota bacterium]|nr:hydrogenase formation protein HypD [Chloroflexota bacterium]